MTTSQPAASQRAPGWTTDEMMCVAAAREFRGVRTVITDLGVLEPDPGTCELTLTRLHPGVTVDQAVAATGWDLAVADDVHETESPSPHELEALRHLESTRGS